MKKEINITREQFFEFVKSKNEDEENESPKYFLKYFDNYQKTGKKVSWNWAVFFFCEFWFLHRKMYVYGNFLLFFFIGVGFGHEHLKNFLFSNSANSQSKEIFSIVMLSVAIVLSILLSIYSNYIYLRFADKKVKEGVFNKGTNMLFVWYPFWVNMIIICIPAPILTIIKSKLLALFHFE